MDNKYWEKFERSGKISDYLDYSAHKTQIYNNFQGEQLCYGSNHQRTCDKGKRV